MTLAVLDTVPEDVVARSASHQRARDLDLLGRARRKQVLPLGADLVDVPEDVLGPRPLVG
jgi:hypothetical protein